MLKINVLAVSETGPIRANTVLRTLIKADPSKVKVIPAVPTPSLVSATYVNALPLGVLFTVHTAKGTREIERKFNGSIVVR
jgi:hypothetical protein